MTQQYSVFIAGVSEYQLRKKHILLGVRPSGMRKYQEVASYE